MNVQLDRRVTIEKRTVAKSGTTGAPVTTWSVQAVVWAERRPVAPSRSEAVRQGLEQARNQVRYRIRYRTGVDSTMRIRDAGEILEIVGGPAELGRREYLEFVAEAKKPT